MKKLLHGARVPSISAYELRSHRDYLIFTENEFTSLQRRVDSDLTDVITLCRITFHCPS